MIIENATIIRIDLPGEYAQATASRPLVEGEPITVRCSWQRPRTGQKWILGAQVTDASAVVYVDGNQTGTIAAGGRLLIRVDGESADRLYRVLAVEPQIGMGMDHTEVYLEAA